MWSSFARRRANRPLSSVPRQCPCFVRRVIRCSEPPVTAAWPLHSDLFGRPKMLVSVCSADGSTQLEQACKVPKEAHWQTLHSTSLPPCFGSKAKKGEKGEDLEKLRREVWADLGSARHFMLCNAFRLPRLWWQPHRMESLPRLFQVASLRRGLSHSLSWISTWKHFSLCSTVFLSSACLLALCLRVGVSASALSWAFLGAIPRQHVSSVLQGQAFSGLSSWQVDVEALRLEVGDLRSATWR